MRSDLPYPRAAVEIAMIGMTVKMGAGDLNPRIFYYPALFMYILLALFGIFFVLGKITGVFPTVMDFQDLFFRDPTAFYMIARSAVLAFMAGSVLLTFLTAKRAFNKEIAIVAAALMTFSITNVHLSHYALTDVPVLFFSLLALFSIVKIMEKAGWKTYLLVGFLIGLATATKYQALFLVFSLFLAHILSLEKMNLRKSVFSGKLAIAAPGVFLGFFLGSPFCMLDYKTFIAYFTRTARVVTNPSYGFASYRVEGALPVYIIKDLLPYSMGILLTVLTVVAVIYALKKHAKIDVLLLGTIFIFVLYIVVSKWSFLKPRHIIHLLPLCFILVGRFLHDMAEFYFKKRKNIALACVTFLVLVPSFYHVWNFEKNINNKTLEIKAIEWIEANIPAGSKIAMQDGISVNPNEASLKRKLKEVRDENIGRGTKLSVMLTNRHLFEKTYDVYELPYPWRLDYDNSDFDFETHIKKGVRYFIFTNELSHYMKEPKKHAVQLNYYNRTKENCVLLKKLTAKPLRHDIKDTGEEDYVLIYELKN